jgi:hypothetical protein
MVYTAPEVARAVDARVAVLRSAKVAASERKDIV